MAYGNESVRGPGWHSALDMGPHEVAGGLFNSGDGSLCRHAPEPLAKEADLAGALHGGLGEDTDLGRQ